AFHNSFHGRTSAAVAATDDSKINAPINKQQKVTFLAFNDSTAFEKEIVKGDVCAVILEAIQGVGGLDEPSSAFYQNIARLCKAHEVVLIADEVQSGFGRSGKFFGFQHHGIKPDIISIAKGMGNGFPVGGILIHDHIKASFGLLGTTFGGNHLACAAVLAVLEVIEKEGLIDNAARMGDYFTAKAVEFPEVKRVKGRGLMLGLEFGFEVAELRKRLIYNQHIFTGGAKDKHVLRILPALNITEAHLDLFFDALKKELP
ncbi:MAG: aminotransferase class III-fold pyridoxal phosphate-dependent enzyme, partial [Flavobacteriales bacterium]